MFEIQNRPIPTIIRDNGDTANLKFEFGDAIYKQVGQGSQIDQYQGTPITGFRDPITGAVYDLDGNFVKFDTSKGGSGILGSEVSSLRAKRLAKYGRKRQGGILRYPAESLSQHTDYFQFDIERLSLIHI